MKIQLHNSLTGKKEIFEPIDEGNIRMYVCGPTVYDRAHIGNARAVVVYDVLFRLLRHLYGENAVTYARNITDVDDKIIAKANETGRTINEITKESTAMFHADMAALGNLPPTHEPRATQHIGDMIAMIQTLIAKGNAYETDGHVLFAVETATDYGQLSGKKLEDLQSGARVAVESYKRNPNDFVLWKPDAEHGFGSPWGKGRPGWHIECSAMSGQLLGKTFDIHGGGADLKFPHHENEIAQSRCAHGGAPYANYWVHNGFVTVNGEKMSKSLGNFTTVQDLLDKGVKGEVIRYVLLKTHYRKPLDFSDAAIEQAEKELDKFYRVVTPAEQTASAENIDSRLRGNDSDYLAALLDDMSVSDYIALMHQETDGDALCRAGGLIGLLQDDAWFAKDTSHIDTAFVETLIAKRAEAKAAKDYAASDAIRDELTAMGVVLKDTPDGTTWEVA